MVEADGTFYKFADFVNNQFMIEPIPSEAAL